MTDWQAQENARCAGAMTPAAQKLNELEAAGTRYSQTVFLERCGTHVAHRTYWDGGKPCFSCSVDVTPGRDLSLVSYADLWERQKGLQ